MSQREPQQPNQTQTTSGKRPFDDYMAILDAMQDKTLKDKQRWIKACNFSSFFYDLRDNRFTLSTPQESHIFAALKQIVEDTDNGDDLRSEALGIIASGFGTNGFMAERQSAFRMVSLATTSSTRALRHRALHFFAMGIQTKHFDHKTPLYHKAYDILIDTWNQTRDTQTAQLLAKNFRDIIIWNVQSPALQAHSSSAAVHGHAADHVKHLAYVMMDSLVLGEREESGKRSRPVQKDICQGLLRCYELGRFDNDAFLALTVLEKCQDFIWPGLKGKIVEDFNRYSGGHFPNIFLHDKLDRIAHLVAT